MSKAQLDAMKRNWKSICDELAQKFSADKEVFLREIQQIVEELEQGAENHLVEAEKRIKTSPVRSRVQKPEVVQYGNPSEFLDDSVAGRIEEHGYGKAYYFLAVNNLLAGKVISGGDMGFAQRFSDQVSDKLLADITDEIAEALDERRLPVSAAASYSYKTQQIYVFGQPKEDLKAIDVSDETRGLMFGLGARSLSREQFKASLVHESTHAYLDTSSSINNLQRKENKRYQVILSLNEAAAHISGSLYYDDAESSAEGYRMQKLDVPKFKTAQNILYSQAEQKFDLSDENARFNAISFVREEAERGIKEMSSRGNIDVAEILTPHAVEEAKRLEAVIRVLDRVDHYTLDIARFLGLENGERERQVVKRIEEHVELDFVDEMMYSESPDGWEPSGVKNFLNAAAVDADEKVKDKLDSDKDVAEIVKELEAKNDGEVFTNFLEKADKALSEIQKMQHEIEENPELAREHEAVHEHLVKFGEVMNEVVEEVREGRDLDDILEELVSRMDEDVKVETLKKKYFQDDSFSPQNLQKGGKELEEELWKVVEAHDKFLTAIEWTRIGTLREFKDLHGRLIGDEEKIERDMEKFANERQSEKREKEYREARYSSSPAERRAERVEKFDKQKEEFASKLEKVEFQEIEEALEITEEFVRISQYIYHVQLWCREWIKEVREELDKLDSSRI